MNSLNIKAHTWARDSHGLYDYECLQVVRNTLKVRDNCLLVRCGTDVKVFTESELKQLEVIPGQESYAKLASISFLNGNLLLLKFRKILCF